MAEVRYSKLRWCISFDRCFPNGLVAIWSLSKIPARPVSVYALRTPRDFDFTSIEMTGDVREFSDSLPWLLQYQYQPKKNFVVPRVGYRKANPRILALAHSEPTL
jgi:hypothetical protein